MTFRAPRSSGRLDDPSRGDEAHGLGTGGAQPTARTHLAISLRTLAGSGLVHVGFAFIAMGGWALYANSGHGLAAAWLPALLQGGLSGLITLVLKRVLERLSGLFASVMAYVLPPAMTASAVLVVLVVVHKLIGTPEIVRTIAVPWSVSTLYAILYSATLARGQAKVTAR